MNTWIRIAMVALCCWIAVPEVGFGAERRATEVTWESMGFAIVERGEVRCPGHGEASPSLFPPWCPADSHTLVRNRVLKCQIMVSSDPRMGGVSTEVINFNVDPSFAGPSWGTMRIDVPSGGTWEGYFTGRFTGPGTAAVRVVLFGTGPLFGMRLKAEGVSIPGNKMTWAGQIKGKPVRVR